MSDAVEGREVEGGGTATAAKKRAKKAAKKPVYVDVDTPFEEVVAADRQGAKLVFDLDLFPTYSAEQQQAFSGATLKLYRTAKQTVEDRSSVDLDEDEVLQRIIAESNNSFARQRLQVQNPDPAYDYRWVYPSNVREYRERYFLEVVNGTGEKTAANPSGEGMHLIGKQGSYELVLMRRKKTITAALDRKRVEQFNKRAGLVKDEYRERGEREGVPVFTDEDEVALRNEFQDAAGSRVREG
jgi:hypothetical protein